MRHVVVISGVFSLCYVMMGRKMFIIFVLSQQLSQDHAEVNLYGIAARYVVMVVSKNNMWELLCNSHAVTIQWFHVIVGPLLST